LTLVDVVYNQIINLTMIHQLLTFAVMIVEPSIPLLPIKIPGEYIQDLIEEGELSGDDLAYIVNSASASLSLVNTDKRFFLFDFRLHEKAADLFPVCWGGAKMYEIILALTTIQYLTRMHICPIVDI
jgi:hypothetical protein